MHSDLNECVLLRVTDDKEESSVSSVTIQVFSGRPWLDIVPSSKGEFEYMALAGYEAFFKDDIAEDYSIRFQLKGAWISYKLEDQFLGKVSKVKGVPEGNVIWYYNVFPNIDIRYTVYGDLLLEEFIVLKPTPVSVIEQSFQVHGVEYELHEDGSIGFYSGETLVFSVPQPVMYELGNPQEKSYGLHYEIVQKGNGYLLRKVIDDIQWLKTAKYPVVIDSSTQGEIADPWEQQGLTPYGQYFENLNEYVDPLTGHLTIRHTDYFLSGRGLDLSVTRIYTTVVAYKQEEDQPGEYVPVATYLEAPTDLGCGWSLDFPWIEVDDESGKYMHLPNGAQVQTNFQNGVWEDSTFGFTMYENADSTYTRYRKNGIREEYDSEGRIISITDLNGNTITFTYNQYGISAITDTVERVVTFSYAGEKLVSISDGVRTTTYSYSGDKLVAVTDPLGRVTSYEYLAGNSFLITGVHYPTGGFSSYEYAVVIPNTGRIAPYKSANSEDGGTAYYVYKVDSHDTVTWTSPKDINTVTVSAGRPCVLQRDDGSLVMYYKDKYVWEETVWKCYGGECWEETIVHTEYWIKRSVSTDQHHWSSPENVIQVKSTTGNPIVIEKQDGSFIMYYKDKYVWTEQDCHWEGCPWDCEYVCETITHTEYWIYRRTSSDGLIWGSAAKVQKTTLHVRDISVIQKQDSTFLMCYTDKVGSSFYIRQKTSNDGITWSSPSNVVQVNSGTGNPALIQRDSGTVYLAYRKGTSIYVSSNSGSGWSSSVETTATAEGDPALIDTDSDIVVIYRGEDDHCYRISSSDGIIWSSPSQIAPNKSLSNPATVARKDRFYRVTAQYISASAVDLVKVLEFSYEGDGYLTWSSDVLIRDAQTLQSSMHFEYDSKGRTVERISKDEQGAQTEKIIYTYNSKNKVVRQDVYAGTSTDISYSVVTGYDDKGNTVYTRDPEGTEHYYSYANTSSENQFMDSKGTPVNLFSNQFYTNSIPSNCHNLPVGEAFINNGKVQETYYKYDGNGNLIETRTLFPTRNYAVFSGTFDENSQTTFEFDLTGLTITDGILVISSIAVPYAETLNETQSETGTGWQNSGSWQGNCFLADYLRCTTVPEPDCFDGQTKIGPFEHYPGSPNYTGYTTWVEDRTQYVQTHYSAMVNEYPEKVEYELNGGSWTEITTNLGSGTTSIVIPASSFVQGLNTLQFQESNMYSTEFEWTLYTEQGAAPEEYITSYTFDSYGNLISITDPENHAKTYSYSGEYGHAYLTSITDALGNTISLSYEFSTGRVTAITDANDNTSTYQYDLLGRATKKVNPDLSEKEVVYDDLNNCVIVYDELDHFMKRYYDGLDRLQAVEWYHNGQPYTTETYTYDYLDNLLTKTDPGGHVYSYQYDSRGRTTKMINPDGTFKAIEFDDVDARVKYIYENGHCREYQYDWVQRVIAVREYVDSVNFYLTQYAYDQAGNLIKQINANNEETNLEYDSLFGPTLITYPDGTSRSSTYDKVGNILAKIDGNGTTLFTYDTVNQQIQIQYPDQSIVQFAYDSNGNCSSVINDHSTIFYAYDNRNRLVSTTQQIDGVGYTFAYNYDVTGSLVSLNYPNGTVITGVYDDLNRLTSVENYAEFTYSVDSLPETMTYSNGVVTTLDYDQCHRPVSITAEKGGIELLHLEYDYDSASNVVQLLNRWLDPMTQLQQTTTESFGYDALDRLISASNGYGTVSFSCDAVGNRMQQIINGETTAYTYLPYDRLATAGEYTFSYDMNGNALSKASDTDEWLYQYDNADRLIGVQHNGQLVGTYVYNGNGQRIKKIEWNADSQQYETIIYLYSQGNVCYEKNVTTGLDAIYMYGPTGRIAKQIGDEIMYYHADHLGSTRLLTDATGSPVTAVEYYPFGHPELTGEHERYLFTGQERDSTGLYYFKARYYDPEMGRFLTQDKWIGDYRRPQTLNKYIYCVNNPLRYADPTGNEVSFSDEIIIDIIAENAAEESEEPPSESDTPNPTEFAQILSELVTLMIIENCDPNGWLTSMNAMREAEAVFDDPEQKKEFEKAWIETFEETCEKYQTPEAAQQRLEEAQMGLEGDLNCLMEYASEGLWGVASGLISSPTEGIEILQTIAYIAQEYYNISIGDEYEAPPPNLNELCRKEEEGMCFGTTLLCIFLGLALLIISMRHEKRRLP